MDASLPALLGGVAALLGAGLLLRVRTAFAAEQQPAWFCALLGLLLAGATPWLAGSEAGLLLTQARDFLALPLLATVALALGRGWQWPGGAWGRVVLGFCLFFEVARQLHYGDDYRLLLQLTSLALVAYAGLLRWPERLPLLLGGTAALSLGAVLLPDLPGAGWLAVPGPLLLALLVLRLQGDGERQNRASPLS